MATGMAQPDVALDHDELYRRFLERNPEFDGQFLTGVLTTGIYCLPSCPARRPKRENVGFFQTPEEARRAGLRPCHRCHPDALYQGEAWYESLFERTAERVRRNPGGFADLNTVALTAGISRTALNDLFHEHAHESVGAFLRRVRVAKACELIARGMPPVDAAAASGFESASAFHQQFLARTGLTPANYAKLGHSDRFTLQLPAHYRARDVLAFQGRDANGISERLTDAGFRKCIALHTQATMIEVSFEGRFAICRTDAEDVRAAHASIARTLGFDTDPAGFERAHSEDKLLGALIRRQTGLRIPQASEPWEALAWAVMGQQISLPAAVRLRREMIAAFGMRHAAGMVAHPSANAIAELEPPALTKLRFPRFKAEYLISAARAVASGAVPLSREWSAVHLARELRKVRGVGAWTIHYSLLRGLGFADCLPASDAGLARGLERLAGERPGEMEIREIMTRFAPWRSLATYHVWASLKGDI